MVNTALGESMSIDEDAGGSAPHRRAGRDQGNGRRIKLRHPAARVLPTCRGGPDLRSDQRQRAWRTSQACTMDDHGQIEQPLRRDVVLVCAGCGKQPPHDFHFPAGPRRRYTSVRVTGTTERPRRRFVRAHSGGRGAAPPGPRPPSMSGHPLLISVHHDRASARCLCGWGFSNATTLKTVRDRPDSVSRKQTGRVGEDTPLTCGRHRPVTVPAACLAAGACGNNRDRCMAAGCGASSERAKTTQASEGHSKTLGRNGHGRSPGDRHVRNAWRLGARLGLIQESWSRPCRRIKDSRRPPFA